MEAKRNETVETKETLEMLGTLEMLETKRSKWKIETGTKRLRNGSETETERQTFPNEMETKRSVNGKNVNFTKFSTVSFRLLAKIENEIV